MMQFPPLAWLLIVAVLCYLLGHNGGQYLVRKRIANRLRSAGWSPRAVKEITR